MNLKIEPNISPIIFEIRDMFHGYCMNLINMGCKYCG